MNSFVVGLLVAALVTQTSTPDQFNLTCKGTAQTFTGAMDGSSPRPPVSWSRTYRVDLAEQSYCQNDCSEVRRIFRVTPDELRLREDGDEVSRVNRRSGVLIVSSTTGAIGHPIADMISAKCEVDDFSGFSRKF